MSHTIIKAEILGNRPNELIIPEVKVLKRHLKLGYERTVNRLDMTPFVDKLNNGIDKHAKAKTFQYKAELLNWQTELNLLTDKFRSTKRKLLLCTFMVIFCLNTKAQQDIYSNVKQLVPASPTTASFAKYGEYPVSLFTGVPEISIPLYEIKTKNFSIPINLTYHASGIKVAEVAGCAGLGWSINAGGQISRFTKGQNDQQKYRNVKKDVDLNVTNNEDFYYIENVFNGQLDAEPDVYRYDFLNYHGKFLFDNYSKPIFIPYCPLKVKNKPKSQWESELEIMDDNGDVFSFNQDNSTSVVSPSSNNIPGQIGWLLTSMKKQNSTDTVIFSYQNTGIGTLNEQRVDVIKFLDGYFKDGGASCPFSEQINGAESSYEVSTYGAEKVIDQITFNNGRVVFYLSNDYRLDTPTPSTFKYLKKIEVYVNTSASPIKTIQFYHNYFSNTIGLNTYKRLRLDSLTIAGTTQNIVERYKFEYNTQAKMPEYKSLSRDYWGYFNNRSNTSLIPQMTLQVSTFSVTKGTSNINGSEPNIDANQAYILKKIYYPTGGFSEFIYETNKFLNNENVEKYAGGLRIKEIKSNDGNNSVITKTYKYGNNENGLGRLNAFFGNDKYISNKLILDCTNNMTGGPLSCSGDSWYVSSELQNSLSSTDGAPVVYPVVTEYIEDADKKSKILYTYSDQPDYNISSTAFDKNLIVDQSFKRGLLLEKTISYQIGGVNKLVYKLKNAYTYFTDTADYNLAFKVVQRKDYICERWDSQRDLYSYFNYPIRYGDNLLKQTEEYTYDSTDDSKYTYSKKIFDYNNRKDCQISRIQYIDSKGINQIKTYKYPTDYPSAPLPPVNTCESEKQNCINAATAKRDQMLAQCNQEPACISAYTSLYNSEITQCGNNFTSCQNNYNNLIQTDQRVITEMQSKNMINSVIEERSLQTSNNSMTLTSGSVNKFKRENGLIVPSERYVLELIGPSSNLTVSSINSSGSLVFHPDYRKKLTYDKYDTNGNLIQYHLSDDITTSYLWSYNQGFPVASLTNGKFCSDPALSEAAYIGFESYEKTNNNPDNDYWSIDREGQSFTTDAKVGKYAWYMTTDYGPTRKVKPASPKSVYIFSGWAKTPASYSGQCYFVLCANDPNGQTPPNGYATVSISNTGGQWKYFQVSLNLANINSSIASVGAYPWKSSGSEVTVDELRLQPVDAQMTTYTYSPLLGMTSKTDPNGITTYYEYDSFGRLKNVKDHEWNILKQTLYHYQNQP